ncbi:hypothetical protein MYAM1_001307 [Malassezia yamatoensis]|uniref:Uncharacterized protein n=1 Tax=Malassezia yamatoensis TaxID=253288 RepID=A0AAJ6CFT1_9BASI|nr:hypothetical protein MYAM1_001307 [Malassezia yamatoensis]
MGAGVRSNPRIPNLLSVGQRPSPAVIATSAPLTSASGLVSVGTSAVASTEDTLSEFSETSFQTTPLAPHQEEDGEYDPASKQASSSAVIMNARSQLEKMLISALPHCNSSATATSSYDTSQKMYTVADTYPNASIDEDHDSDNALTPSRGTQDESFSGDRHVYFDERTLNRQSSRQFWHHEARNARRLAFSPNTPQLEKRQALEHLLWRVQDQIEDAGNRLRRAPSSEWRFPGLTNDEPFAEPLAYQVRRTIRPRPAVPILEERPGIARPFRIALQLSLELHAPLWSRPAPQLSHMRRRVVGAAQEAVRQTLDRKRIARQEERMPHANLALAWLPDRALLWMISTLDFSRNTSQDSPTWMRWFMRTHERMEQRWTLMQVTIPTFLLYRSHVIIVMTLELVLVASQLLSVLLTVLLRVRHEGEIS